MRNLKKILAVALALAMAFSMLASAASFPDVTDGTDQAEAIDLLAGLGVLGGYEDGTFRPEGTITRGEFLKVLFVICNGSDDQSLYSGDSSTYSDVTSDQWYASYVNWATQLGIVGGYPDGTFKADNPVTVAEAAKMFVVALGYSAADYEFPYGYIDRAQRSTLFSSVSGFSANSPALRGVVAQMAYNFLFVEDGPGYSFWNRELTTPGWDYKTPLEQNFAAVEYTAVVNGTSTANPGALSTKRAGRVNFSQVTKVNSSSTATGFANGDYEYEGIDELVGERVTVWSKQDDNGKAIILAVIPNSDLVYTFTAADVLIAQDDVDDMVKGDIYVTINGENIPIAVAAGTTTAAENFAAMIDNALINNGVSDSRFINFVKSYTAADTNAQITFKLVVDDEDDTAIVQAWDFVGITAYAVDQVTAKTNTTITLRTFNSSSSIRADRLLATVSDFEKEDYAVVFVEPAIVDSAVVDTYTLQKAEVQTGVVRSVSVSRGTANIGGTTYGVAFQNTVDLGDLTIGEEVELFLDRGGYIYASDAVSSTENYMLIKAVGGGTAESSDASDSVTVTGLLADGTTQKFNIDADALTSAIESASGVEIYNNGWTKIDSQVASLSNNAMAVGQLVVYTLNGDGEIDFIGAPTEPNESAANREYRYTTGASTIYYKTTGSYLTAGLVNSDTVFFVVDSNNSTTFSDWTFNVYTYSRISSFEDTKIEFINMVEDTMYVDAVLISDEMNTAQGTDFVLVLPTGNYETNYDADTKEATLSLEFIAAGVEGDSANYGLVEYPTMTVSVSSGNTSTVARTVMSQYIKSNLSFASANEYGRIAFGYADVQSGSIAGLYATRNGFVYDAEQSGSIASVTDDRTGGVTVYAGYVTAVEDTVITVSDFSGSAFANETLLPVASDCAITIVESDIDYVSALDAGTLDCVVAETVNAINVSSVDDQYLVVYATRHQNDNASNPVEVYQIIAFNVAA